MMNRERVVVADILRPRGNRGELLAKSQTDVPGRLETLKRAAVTCADGSELPVEIDAAWPHNAEWVFKFSGVDSIESAERFRGAEIWIPFSERGRLEDGAFFHSDLIGCTLIDAETGSPLGVVESLEQYGGPPLMQVRSGAREVLIPFVPAICRGVDLGAKAITVDLPEGLLEL